ncbi:MAG: 2-oxoglutarate dehydrogenase E1 component [Deltaproteobacteria bacterium]|nr:2-oxoglutarate dehydrogenase E1 component [Deltaproteobacteria bacterium]
MSTPDFANISNAAYVEELYEKYLADPACLSEDWRSFFGAFELEHGGPTRRDRLAALERRAEPAPPFAKQAPAAGAAKASGLSRRETVIEPTTGVFDLIHSYRDLGHLIADLDPLGDNQTSHPLLELSEFGFRESDLDRVFECPSFRGKSVCRLGELVDLLRATYCGTIGVEYMTIQSKEQRDWIKQRIEPTLNKPDLSDLERKAILEQLFRTNGFEQFLHKKYVGAKRFSIEGGDSLVPLLQNIIDESADAGVREIVMGMPHRGRLNVLTHILGKPYEMMFSEFEGSFLPDSIQGDGDVKYHLGYSRDYTAPRGQQLHVSLLFNPSHLEAINPVAEGIVAGKQHYLGDHEHRLVLPVLMHGDAAFMGQGLVMETLALSELAGFHTGGTIHIVVNNQVGFTTSPRDYRFTRYPTELAKLIGAPVLHVNADDPEAVVQAARFAAAFRARFAEDVMIDLVCYRRHGHNELDDPTFTQPVMYKKITARPTAPRLYAARLVAAGVVTEDEVRALEDKIQHEFETALEYARDFMPRQQVFTFGGAWKDMTWAGTDQEARTRVRPEALLEVVDSLAVLPDGFNAHPKVKRLYAERSQMLEAGTNIDWGCAEMLALGTLLMEGTAVRLSGQDAGRGTFSHRHAALYDRDTNERYVPLDHMSDTQGRFYLIDSNLSEAGVLGFEYGFSSADPRNLVIWEAQFGDFANGAQVIIDQFMTSAESKWQRMNGLVLLLPHGYEGQGPEHSSARLERFLAMAAEQNIQVCNMTNPAQLFHVLRRQMHRKFRKPLVIMSPKSMLRSKFCQSRMEEFTDRDFRRVLGETEDIEAGKVRRVLLCSGKIYYDLVAGRQERRIRDVAIVRVEQLYPFPLLELREVLARYPSNCEVFWVQEEPKNMGAWRFISDRNHMIFNDGRALAYVGRDAAASPATGSYKNHQSELRALVNNAYCPPRITLVPVRRKRSHGS